MLVAEGEDSLLDKLNCFKFSLALIEASGGQKKDGKSRAMPDAILAHVGLIMAWPWIFPPLDAAAPPPLTALMC